MLDVVAAVVVAVFVVAAVVVAVVLGLLSRRPTFLQRRF